MLISQLPPEIREVALQRQRECKDICCDKNTDHLEWAFVWDETPEGGTYWGNLSINVIEIQNDDQIIM